MPVEDLKFVKMMAIFEIINAIDSRIQNASVDLFLIF